MHPCTSFLRRLDMSKSTEFTLLFVALTTLVVYTGILCAQADCNTTIVSFGPVTHVDLSY